MNALLIWERYTASHKNFLCLVQFNPWEILLWSALFYTMWRKCNIQDDEEFPQHSYVYMQWSRWTVWRMMMWEIEEDDVLRWRDGLMDGSLLTRWSSKTQYHIISTTSSKIIGRKVMCTECSVDVEWW